MIDKNFCDNKAPDDPKINYVDSADFKTGNKFKSESPNWMSSLWYSSLGRRAVWWCQKVNQTLLWSKSEESVKDVN